MKYVIVCGLIKKKDKTNDKNKWLIIALWKTTLYNLYLMNNIKK